MSKEKPVLDFEAIERMMDADPEDWFPAKERARRLEEFLGRALRGNPASFDGHSGQNKASPFLADDELTERGYPAPKAPFK